MGNIITNDIINQVLDSMIKDIEKLSFKYHFDDEELWNIAKDKAEAMYLEAKEDRQ